MNEAFPRIMTLLRKEKKLSQKQAAADLQISQALLSHYEKGIRECGLEFLVRAADYYGVSCDYLLGRTPDRTGAVLTVDDLPDADFKNTDKQFKGGVVAVLNKKLVTNSLTVVFDLLLRSGSKPLTNALSAYLMLAVYQVFRLIYRTDPRNPGGQFELAESVAAGYAHAEMVRAMTDAECARLALAENQRLALTPEQLKAQYPYFYQSLVNLIQRTEALLRPTDH